MIENKVIPLTFRVSIENPDVRTNIVKHGSMANGKECIEEA